MNPFFIFFPFVVWKKVDYNFINIYHLSFVSIVAILLRFCLYVSANENGWRRYVVASKENRDKKGSKKERTNDRNIKDLVWDL